MKKTFYLLLVFFCSVSYYSCKKMDDTFKEFVVPGGIIYPGKATAPIAYPGKNRVMLSWQKGTDPNVSKARIYWNNFTESIDVNVDPEDKIINVVIEELKEQSYTFTIVTYDFEGNKSVSVEINCDVFGEHYASGLVNRVVELSDLDSDGRLILQMNNAAILNGAIYTEFYYTNISEEEIIKKVPAELLVDTLFDYKRGTSYKHRTVFIPDSGSIDYFFTEFIVVKEISQKLQKSSWIATASSYEMTGQLPNGSPYKVIDDDLSTFWHSRHTSSPTGYPHWLAVDLQQNVVLTKVELTSRSTHFHQDFTDFILQGSVDGLTWIGLHEFKLQETGNTQSFIINNAAQFRHVRIYMTKGPTVHSHLAEFSVYGIL